MDCDAAIQVRVFGLFEVIGPNGESLTPKGNKNQALIALVLSSDGFARSRTWLQDKLWSDRPQEQGSASLRQSLTAIRSALREYSTILCANRTRVWLDAARVAPIERTSSRQVYLEGIDVKDPEFEDWLTQERAAHDSEQRPSAQFASVSDGLLKLQGRSLHLQYCNDGGQGGEAVERHLADAVARLLTETASMPIVRGTDTSNSENALRLAVRASRPVSEDYVVEVSLEEAVSGLVHWTAAENVPHSGGKTTHDLSLLCLANRAVERIEDVVVGHNVRHTRDPDPALMSNLALRKIFTIDEAELQVADRLLERASEMGPRGVFYAWRSQLRVIQAVEKFRDDLDVIADECDELCAKALDMDPINSYVLAAVANTRAVIENNPIGASELAKLAAVTGPSNPMAWFSYSNALQYIGDYKNAHLAALRARGLAAGTRMMFWCASQCALTAAYNRDFEAAARFAALSNGLAPRFRAALRQNLVIQSNRKDHQTAAQFGARLAAVEPGFEIAKIIEDQDYPVRAMRQAGLVERDHMEKTTALIKRCE